MSPLRLNAQNGILSYIKYNKWHLFKIRFSLKYLEEKTRHTQTTNTQTTNINKYQNSVAVPIAFFVNFVVLNYILNKARIKKEQRNIQSS